MKRCILVVILSGILLFSGCGRPDTTRFVHPEFDFSFIEAVAVVPFENLTNDQGMGAKATRFFLVELLASEAFWVMEPGEVTFALQDLGYTRTAQMSTDQIKELGTQLGVQGLFLGTVNESTTMRGGGRAKAVVSVVLRLVETETGETVWSASNSSDNGTFWSAAVGTSPRSHSEVLLESLRNCLKTLLD